MKPNFALDLRNTIVRLLHRSGQSWTLVGAADALSGNVAREMGYLRRTALELSPRGFSCKLIIPNDHILYTTLSAPGPEAFQRRSQIRMALAGRTPFAVDDLVFDWWGSGTDVQVAVIARETLAEAEAFALAHRMNPISFVAIPEAGKFRGEPWFGAADFAAMFVAADDKPERDQDPVTEVRGGATVAVLPVAQGETEVPTPSPEAPRERPVERPPAAPEPAPEPVETPEPAPEESPDVPDLPEDPTLPPNFPPALPELPSDEPEEAPQDEPPEGPNKGPNEDPGTMPGDEIPGDTPVEIPGFEPATFAAETSAWNGGHAAAERANNTNGETGRGPLPGPIEAEAEPDGPFGQGLVFAHRGTSDALSAEDTDHTEEDKELGPAAPEGPFDGGLVFAQTAGLGGDAPIALDVEDDSLDDLEAGDETEGTDGAFAFEVLAPKSEVSAASLTTPVASETLQDLGNRGLKALRALVTDQEIPGTGKKTPGTPRAGRAARKNRRNRPLLEPRQPAAPAFENADMAAQHALSGIGSRAGIQTGGRRVSTTYLLGGGLAAILVLFWLLSLVGNTRNDLPASASIPSSTAEAQTPMADDEMLADLEPLALGTGEAATGGATDAPAPDNEVQKPVSGPVLSGAGLPPSLPSTPSLPEVGLQQDSLPIVAPPPDFGTVYQFDDKGRILPTPEGIVTPQGVRLVAGAPPMVPPARPVTARPLGGNDPRLELAAPAMAAGSEEFPQLAPVRPDEPPQPRPASPADMATVPEPVDPALAALRPRARPEGIAPIAEAPAQTRIVEISPRPAARPALISKAVEAALAAALAEPVPTQDAAPTDKDLAAVAVEEGDGEPENSSAAQPEPSKGLVADEATVSNAINLSKISLIGIYGTASARYAMVRMATGKIRKVSIGDALDGGKVVAISEDSLSYQKGGRVIELKMPKA